MRDVEVANYRIGEGAPLLVICGPCVIEGEEACLEAAAALKEIFDQKGIPFVFKSSYDKANRSSIRSYRGPGLKEGMRILKRVKEELDLPLLTDIHEPGQAAPVAEVCDILQIPAFLCRQTDLLVAAAETDRVVNVKKGQFMAPWDMKNVVEKLREAGSEKIFLTERGVSFGYNYLVSDMCSIPVMKGLGVPVCYDATHSVQLPGGRGSSSGGKREFVPLLARAALAAGANLLYLEAHPDPDKAMSDAATQIPIRELPDLLDKLLALYKVVNG